MCEKGGKRDENWAKRAAILTTYRVGDGRLRPRGNRRRTEGGEEEEEEEEEEGQVKDEGAARFQRETVTGRRRRTAIQRVSSVRESRPRLSSASRRVCRRRRLRLHFIPWRRRERARTAATAARDRVPRRRPRRTGQPPPDVGQRRRRGTAADDDDADDATDAGAALRRQSFRRRRRADAAP